MAACPKCGVEVAAHAVSCSACGSSTAIPHTHGVLSSIFAHIPHPHIAHRKKKAPSANQPMSMGPVTRFNNFLGLKITNAVGTMWCAYAFAALALVSLPEAYKGGTAAFIAWIAQTFLQLVLLSIIIVGQKVASESTDKRATDTYNDAEAVLHESIEIQKHLAAQDALLQKLIDELVERRPSPTASPSPAIPS